MVTTMNIDGYIYRYSGTPRKDYLEIRDGRLEESSILSRLSGDEIPAPIQSTQNFVRLRYEEHMLFLKILDNVIYIAIRMYLPMFCTLDSTQMNQAIEQDFKYTTIQTPIQSSQIVVALMPMELV